MLAQKNSVGSGNLIESGTEAGPNNIIVCACHPMVPAISKSVLSWIVTLVKCLLLKGSELGLFMNLVFSSVLFVSLSFVILPLIL